MSRSHRTPGFFHGRYLGTPAGVPRRCRPTGHNAHRGHAGEGAGRRSRRVRCEQEPQEGSASLAVLGAAVVTLLIVMGLADIGIFFVVRARAQTAADAAALAAAAELIPGLGQDAEGQAARFARANGARLSECECRMGSRAAQVKVAAPADFLLLSPAGNTEVTARARAEVNPAGLRGQGGS